MSDPNGKNTRAEVLNELAQKLQTDFKASTAQIREVNEDIHVLSINAKIEAARAGNHGAGFAVVADNIKFLVERTHKITHHLDSSVQQLVSQLASLSSELGVEVRGQHFAQAAFHTIEIIDRNLYERSCDVRWWASDSSVVTAAQDPNPGNIAYATQRLGQILDSYTVYHDIVLVDRDGTVLANGRPAVFNSRGKSVKAQPWFTRACSLASGAEFSFQGAHASFLANDTEILVYACGVREGGNPDGRLCGVLGLIFKWVDLSTVAINRTHEELVKSEGAQSKSSVLLVEPDARVIAAVGFLARVGTHLPREIMDLCSGKTSGYSVLARGDTRILLSYALSPGYETYSTGWYCITACEI